MPFARETPYSDGRLKSAISTNVSEGSRADARASNYIRSFEKELRTLMDRKIELEREFAEIKDWTIRSLAATEAVDEKSLVLSTARQQKTPLRVELREIETKVREMKESRRKEADGQNRGFFEIMERLEAKVDSILRHLEID